MEQGLTLEDQGKYTLLTDEEDPRLGMFDKPPPCFGCGIGWFCFLLGLALPLMWYFATILFFSNYYRKDPRERSGLAASAIAVGPGLFCLIINYIRCHLPLDQVAAWPLSGDAFGVHVTEWGSLGENAVQDSVFSSNLRLSGPQDVWSWGNWADQT